MIKRGEFYDPENPLDDGRDEKYVDTSFEDKEDFWDDDD